jgi:hypothetical protein
MIQSTRSGDTHQGCVILKTINIDDGCLDGESREGSDFHPGLGHEVEDLGMREIQCIPKVASS